MSELRDKYKITDRSVYDLQAEDNQRRKEIAEKQKACRDGKNLKEKQKEAARKAGEKAGISVTSEDREDR